MKAFSYLRHAVTGCGLLFTGLLLPSACITEPEYDASPRGNFEALWKMIDEHYCFFREKQVNWDSIHRVYAPRFNDAMTDRQLFEVLDNMLAELRDGHVNLTSSFNVARYWAFHESYPSNYSDTLIRRYLGTDYQIASGLKYRILDDNIGYIRCETFQNSLGDGNLDEILLALQPCNALIIDLRNNGGGLITSAEKLAARFTNRPVDVGFVRHKTGRAHAAAGSQPGAWHQVAETRGRADEPHGIFGRQRVCKIHEMLPPCNDSGRPHRRRRRPSLLI